MKMASLGRKQLIVAAASLIVTTVATVAAFGCIAKVGKAPMFMLYCVMLILASNGIYNIVKDLIGQTSALAPTAGVIFITAVCAVQVYEAFRLMASYDDYIWSYLISIAIALVVTIAVCYLRYIAEKIVTRLKANCS